MGERRPVLGCNLGQPSVIEIAFAVCCSVSGFSVKRLNPHICRYKGWSEAVGKATASVAVLYASDYGFSDRLSQTLARGITKAGVATDMVDLLSVDAQVRVLPAQTCEPCADVSVHVQTSAVLQGVLRFAT